MFQEKNYPEQCQYLSFSLLSLKQEINLNIPKFQIVAVSQPWAEGHCLSGGLHQTLFSMWGNLTKGLRAFNRLESI